MKVAVGFIAMLWAMSAMAAPPPPLAPEKSAFYQSFFAAFPNVFPAQDISKFGQFVDQDVQVFSDGKLVHSNRQAWLASLQAMGGHANGVQRFSMSREEFYFQPNDRIMVHEFWMPLADGVFWHPEFPHKMVSYQFKDQKLVRVDYIVDFRPTGQKFGEAK